MHLLTDLKLKAFKFYPFKRWHGYGIFSFRTLSSTLPSFPNRLKALLPKLRAERKVLWKVHTPPFQHHSSNPLLLCLRILNSINWNDEVAPLVWWILYLHLWFIHGIFNYVFRAVSRHQWKDLFANVIRRFPYSTTRCLVNESWRRGTYA